MVKQKFNIKTNHLRKIEVCIFCCQSDKNVCCVVKLDFRKVYIEIVSQRNAKSLAEQSKTEYYNRAGGVATPPFSINLQISG